MGRLTRWNGSKWVLPQGMWREIADRLAAYENTGLEPEQIVEMQRGGDVEKPVLALQGDIYTAVVLEREKGGNVPYVDPIDCCARLYAAEVEANADNAEVIRERGANHLVIEVYADHWHVAQVSGYTPKVGLFTKLY